MIHRVVLATHNAHKVAEVRRIMHAEHHVHSGGIELLGLDWFPTMPETDETGATFAENALLKAHAAAAFTGLVAIADDSGIAVDALNGMPGVLSVYWAGRARDDDANMRLLLEQIHDVPDEERGGAFVCAAAAAAPDGREIVVEGRRWLRLRPDLRADGGVTNDGRDVAGGEGRDQPSRSRIPRVGTASGGAVRPIGGCDRLSCGALQASG